MLMTKASGMIHIDESQSGRSSSSSRHAGIVVNSTRAGSSSQRLDVAKTFHAKPARVSLGQLKVTWVLGDLG
jgi:hypothetical protein